MVGVYMGCHCHLVNFDMYRRRRRCSGLRLEILLPKIPKMSSLINTHSSNPFKMKALFEVKIFDHDGYCSDKEVYEEDIPDEIRYELLEVDPLDNDQPNEPTTGCTSPGGSGYCKGFGHYYARLFGLYNDDEERLMAILLQHYPVLPAWVDARRFYSVKLDEMTTIYQRSATAYIDFSEALHCPLESVRRNYQHLLRPIGQLQR